MNLQRMAAWTAWQRELPADAPAVYVLASYTAEPLLPHLGLALGERGYAWRPVAGPYNQIVQSLSAPDSRVEDETVACTVLAMRFEDLFDGALQRGPEGLAAADADLEILIAAIRRAAARAHGPLIAVLPALPLAYPWGLGDLSSGAALHARAMRWRSRMIDALADQPGLWLLDAEALLRQYGAAELCDREMELLARVPYRERFFAELAEQIARVLTLGRTQRLVMYLALLLCDIPPAPTGQALRTVAFSEAPLSDDATVLDEQRQFAVALAWGQPLTLVSALSREEARARLAATALAELPSDRYELVADCADLRAALPSGAGVRYLCLGQDAAPADDVVVLPEARTAWWATLERAGCWDRHRPLARLEQSGDVAADDPLARFYATLELTVELRPVTTADVAAAVHQFETVSEFRTAAGAYDADTVAAWLERPQLRLLGIHVRDRFGDYGLAGLFYGERRADAWQVHDFLMNCRVLGKRAEYRALARLAELAADEGCARIVFYLQPGARNALGIDFLRALLRRTGDGTEGESLSVAPHALARVAAAALDDGAEEARTEAPVAADVSAVDDYLAQLGRRRATRPAVLARAERELLDELAQPSQLLAAIARGRRAGRSEQAAYVAPETATERELAALWAEILRVERVGVLDNFFTLGGSSLLATQLIVRFREAFGVALPIRIFFDQSNVRQMAAHIDAVRREQGALPDLDEMAVENYRIRSRAALAGEIQLDPAIRADGLAPAKRAADCRVALLTGATGFLGAYLLAELLRRTDYELCLLVRAADEAAARRRVRENLAYYHLPWPEDEGRLRIVVGDLAQPQFGLSREAWQRLAAEVDVIYHNGANTNFLEPYEMLRPANVDGTERILALATQKRLKTVHYVSTHYVFSTISHADGTHIREDALPTPDEILVMGYQQTKMVAEQLIGLARARGVPASIYRPGRIAGATADGACQAGDFVWQMLQCCVDAGLMFAEETTIELIPVDYIARAIAHISLQDEAVNLNFHLINRRRTPIGLVEAWTLDRGFEVARYPYHEWRGRLVERVREDASLVSVAAMLPFLTEDVVLDVALDLSTENTDRLLAGSGIERCEVDAELFGRYLDYFIESGFLNPKQNARSEICLS